MSEIYCEEFTGYTITLILKRINKLIADEGASCRIVNIETVRSKARQILVRVWYIV